MTIDLRSDTVTRPSIPMRRVMAEAEVGDDVYGDDPTVNRLEQMAAEMLDFEAALFAASGTQTNLIALLAHCGRGDEYLVGQEAHTYKYEGGGGAVLGSIQPQPIEFEADGTLDLDLLAAKIKPDDFHYARTRLLCLENTQNGKALPMGYLRDAADFARKHRLSFHLDGARLFNAAIHHRLPAAEITAPFDSVSICLSKGLGAPVGSLLLGNREFISQARRWRKMVGGGMRQAGILAAGGIYALTNNIERLQEDHDNAQRIATKLSCYQEIEVEMAPTQTNMVFCRLKKSVAKELAAFLCKRDILILAEPKIRLVTHLDISEDDVTTFLAAVDLFFAR